MSKDYEKGFKDAVEKINDLLLSEYKAYRKETKGLIKDTDYLSLYENKVRMEDIEFYFHEFRSIVNEAKGKDYVDEDCNCLICKGE